MKKSKETLWEFGQFFYISQRFNVSYILDRHRPLAIPSRYIDIMDKSDTIDGNSALNSEASKLHQMYLLATKSLRISDSPYFRSPERQIPEELSGDSIEQISEGQIQRHLALNENIYGNILRDMRDVPIISKGKYLAYPSKIELGIRKSN